MLTVRRASDRGRGEHGWLDTRHTFAFANYYDPAHVGFRALRVLNEDRVAPGQGFGTHGHRDMEILTCVLAGALEHRDSLGNGAVLRPGEFQCMTAGTGVRHSEFNPSATEPVHFYQIWMLPERPGLTPQYEQRAFPKAEDRNALRLVAARDGRQGALTVHQDADVYLTRLDPESEIALALRPGRHAWLQLLRGAAACNGVRLSAGDGLSASAEAALAVRAGPGGAEALVFYLA